MGHYKTCTKTQFWVFTFISWCCQNSYKWPWEVHDLSGIYILGLHMVMISVLSTQIINTKLPKSGSALLRSYCSENPQLSTKIMITLWVSTIYKHTKNNLSLPNLASQCQQTFSLVKENVRSLFIPLTLQLVNIHPPHCG